MRYPPLVLDVPLFVQALRGQVEEASIRAPIEAAMAKKVPTYRGGYNLFCRVL